MMGLAYIANCYFITGTQAVKSHGLPMSFEFVVLYQGPKLFSELFWCTTYESSREASSSGNILHWKAWKWLLLLLHWPWFCKIYFRNFHLLDKQLKRQRKMLLLYFILFYCIFYLIKFLSLSLKKKKKKKERKKERSRYKLINKIFLLISFFFFKIG